MRRRLSTLLLAAAMLVAGVVAQPCITQACTLALVKHMACCNDAVRAGIGAPDCCGGSQLQQPAAAPVADQPVRTTVSAAQHALPVAVTSPPVPLLPLRVHDVGPGGGPPGGPLTAQHTSLLL